MTSFRNTLNIDKLFLLFFNAVKYTDISTNSRRTVFALGVNGPVQRDGPVTQVAIDELLVIAQKLKLYSNRFTVSVLLKSIYKIKKKKLQNLH